MRSIWENRQQSKSKFCFISIYLYRVLDFRFYFLSISIFIFMSIFISIFITFSSFRLPLRDRTIQHHTLRRYLDFNIRTYCTYTLLTFYIYFIMNDNSFCRNKFLLCISFLLFFHPNFLSYVFSFTAYHFFSGRVSVCPIASGFGVKPSSREEKKRRWRRWRWWWNRCRDRNN